MTPPLKSITAGLALLGLVACGSAGGEKSVGGALVSNLAGGVLGTRKAPAAAPPLTRDTVAQFKGTVFLARVPSRGGSGLLIELQSNKDVTTFTSGDGITVMIRDGRYVVGTRGFGDDLMAADVVGLPKALARGTGQYPRVMQFLSGLDQITTNRFTCTVTPQGPEQITIMGKRYNTHKLLETCVGPAGEFVNAYWMQGRQLWQSSQWVSRSVGAVVLQKLK